MNTLDDLFPSKFLKASDAEHGDLVVTIKSIKLEEMQGEAGKENKPVVYFEEVEKGLVLNKTNKETLQKLHGNDIKGLTGKRIALFSTEVQSFGEMVLALRIRLKAPDNGAAVTGPSIADLKARYFERANEAAQLGIVAETIGDDATADQIIAAGKALKAKIDKANEF